MNKYFIYSLAALSLLASAEVNAYQREGCGGGVCNSGCHAPQSSYQGYNDLDGPYYDHRGPDVAPLYRNGRTESPGARLPDNRRFTRFQGELPGTPSTGDRHHWFNPQTVSMFKGEVLNVAEVDGFRGNKVVRLVIKTNQGDDVEVRLGPKAYIDEKKFVLNQGDKIDIKGSKVNWDGRTIIIAQEIKRNGDTLTLRDNDGKPNWKEEDRRDQPASQFRSDARSLEERRYAGDDLRYSNDLKYSSDERVRYGDERRYGDVRYGDEKRKDSDRDTRSGWDKARQSWNETRNQFRSKNDNLYDNTRSTSDFRVKQEYNAAPQSSSSYKLYNQNQSSSYATPGLSSSYRETRSYSGATTAGPQYATPGATSSYSSHSSATYGGPVTRGQYAGEVRSYGGPVTSGQYAGEVRSYGGPVTSGQYVQGGSSCPSNRGVIHQGYSNIPPSSYSYELRSSDALYSPQGTTYSTTNPYEVRGSSYLRYNDPNATSSYTNLERRQYSGSSYLKYNDPNATNSYSNLERRQYSGGYLRYNNPNATSSYNNPNATSSYSNRALYNQDSSSSYDNEIYRSEYNNGSASNYLK